jgi:hypothetical protein
VSKFAGLADAISDALAAWSAAELDEPADVDEAPRALAAWTEDLSHALFRTAGRLSESGIHTRVPDAVYDAATSSLRVADDTGELAHFSLMRLR